MVDPKLKDKELKTILAELRDINKEKRRTAVMKLGMFGGDVAVTSLIYILENDYEDLIVRGRAALMLGKLRDGRAVNPLIRALDAPGFQTPLNAVKALGAIGDPRAIEPLLSLAETSRDRLQKATHEALDRLDYHNTTESEPEPGM